MLDGCMLDDACMSVGWSLNRFRSFFTRLVFVRDACMSQKYWNKQPTYIRLPLYMLRSPLFLTQHFTIQSLWSQTLCKLTNRWSAWVDFQLCWGVSPCWLSLLSCGSGLQRCCELSRSQVDARPSWCWRFIHAFLVPASFFDSVYCWSFDCILSRRCNHGLTGVDILNGSKPQPPFFWQPDHLRFYIHVRSFLSLTF